MHLYTHTVYICVLYIYIFLVDQQSTLYDFYNLVFSILHLGKGIYACLACGFIKL